MLLDDERVFDGGRCALKLGHLVQNNSVPLVHGKVALHASEQASKQASVRACSLVKTRAQTEGSACRWSTFHKLSTFHSKATGTRSFRRAPQLQPCCTRRAHDSHRHNCTLRSPTARSCSTVSPALAPPLPLPPSDTIWLMYFVKTRSTIRQSEPLIFEHCSRRRKDYRVCRVP